MLQETISSIFKKVVERTGMLPWWEERLTRWPRVVFYHSVGATSQPFLRDAAIEKNVFLDQISALRLRYRFLSWQEYKEAVADPQSHPRTLLLTFDDGFRSTWETLTELVYASQVPAVFFVNTRVLDNAYAPWMTQYYFLRAQASLKFLEPLWNSISRGTALSPARARERCHECFGLNNVVEPIEEGLARFGMTPAELAQEYRLYVASSDLSNASELVEIGNHSHSHYILSKLGRAELDADLRSSHDILTNILGEQPECFAYPFGTPSMHFNGMCLESLRRVGSYPYVFSGSNRLPLAAAGRNEIARTCLDHVLSSGLVGTVAEVAPRILKNRLLASSKKAS